MCGRTVTLKVRYANFTTITRSKTLAAEIDTTPAIFEVAKALFLKLDPARPRIRLLGVSLSGLAAGPPRRQLHLLTEAGGRAVDEKWDDATKALDSIRDRFGSDAVGPATLLRSDLDH
jgi:DNA polymerase-4